jgi:hemerythrin superfamily protein
MASHRPAPRDAIALLENDHRTVEKLFRDWEGAADAREKARIAGAICQALTVHAEIEEALFYPQALYVLDPDGDDLVWEATVEHGTLRGLIARLDGKRPGVPVVDAHLTVLMEYVKHHVREEERELFPAVRKTDLDLVALGERMAEMKEELEARVERGAAAADGVVHLVNVTAREQGHDDGHGLSRSP